MMKQHALRQDRGILFLDCVTIDMAGMGSLMKRYLPTMESDSMNFSQSDSAGIWTHDLSVMSPPLYQLSQGATLNIKLNIKYSKTIKFV